jgi:hypothetical protein
MNEAWGEEYEPCKVFPELYPIFDQLRTEFEDKHYKTRVAHADFGRTTLAGIISNGSSIILIVHKGRSFCRELKKVEIEKIRNHLNSGMGSIELFCEDLKGQFKEGDKK